MSKKLNILLVEDNELDARLCIAILAAHFDRPHSVYNVTFLGSAISEIEREDIQYDLVLLDLNLNDSRGIYTLQAFKDCCSKIPVIIMSGIEDEDVIRNAITKGADSYIVKGKDDAKMVVDEINHVLDNYAYKMGIKPRVECEGGNF